jgi:hypothetical protein
MKQGQQLLMRWVELQQARVRAKARLVRGRQQLQPLQFPHDVQTQVLLMISRLVAPR